MSAKGKGEPGELKKSGIERYSAAVQICMVNRHWIRKYFGLSEHNKKGYFLDRHMTAIVHGYYRWIYPANKGSLEEHVSEITCAVVTTDGNYLFTGSKDKSIVHWDLTQYIMVNKWAAMPTCLAHTNNILVSGDTNGNIHVWKGSKHKNGHYQYSLLGSAIVHSDCVTSLACNQDESIGVSASCDGEIRVWSVETGKCLHSLAETNGAGIVQVMSVNSWLVIGTADVIHIYDQELGVAVTTQNLNHSRSLKHISLNSDVSIVATVSEEEVMLRSWPELESIMTVDKPVSSVCFHPRNPHILAVAWLSGSVDLFDIRKWSHIHKFGSNSLDVFDRLCFTPDGSRLMGCSTSVAVWPVQPIWLNPNA